MRREFDVQMVVGLLMGAAHALDEAYPNDPEPVVQSALREMSWALYEDREPEFDYRTSKYLAEFIESMDKYAEETQP